MSENPGFSYQNAFSQFLSTVPAQSPPETPSSLGSEASSGAMSEGQPGPTPEVKGQDDELTEVVRRLSGGSGNISRASLVDPGYDDVSTESEESMIPDQTTATSQGSNHDNILCGQDMTQPADSHPQLPDSSNSPTSAGPDPTLGSHDNTSLTSNTQGEASHKSEDKETEASRPDSSQSVESIIGNQGDDKPPPFSSYNSDSRLTLCSTQTDSMGGYSEEQSMDSVAESTSSLPPARPSLHPAAQRLTFSNRVSTPELLQASEAYANSPSQFVDELVSENQFELMDVAHTPEKVKTVISGPLQDTDSQNATDIGLLQAQANQAPITDPCLVSDLGVLAAEQLTAPPSEDSQSLSLQKKQEPSKEGEEAADHHEMTADKVFEYQWPHETGGEIFLLQEHISEYLGVLSFKRKYPDLNRRPVEYKERIFLTDRGAVTETQCDLGLTALRSDEVYELLSKDYPEKYKEYIESLRDRERRRLTEQTKGYTMATMEKAKMDYFMKKSVRSAAEYNANMMRERAEERQAYFDLQTMEVHYPISKRKVLPRVLTDPGPYPVALLPGQYQDHYKRYTSKELKYFPLNTALYSPHRALKTIYADPNADRPPREETAVVAKEEAGSSSSGDSSQSSDSETDSIEPEVRGQKISEEQIKKLLATPRPDTPPKKTRRRNLAQLNGGAAGDDSEKDSEAGSVKGKKVKTPARKTPGRGQKRPLVKVKGNQSLCSICQTKDSKQKEDSFVQCSECKKHAHPSCLELTEEMIPIVRTYPWQCMDCKTCVNCKDAHDEEKMMFCDLCDRGYHTFCVGLKSIPPGRWECPTCTTEAPPPRKKGRQKKE